jgi:outer membrane protein assembly factor BamB
VCVSRKNGDILWSKAIRPTGPVQKYGGFLALHGYASSTPATDGKHVYFFFGKTGVFCFDLQGNQVWQKSVGNGTDGWGSATSPLLYKDKVIINASVESNSLVALNKATGEQEWAVKGMKQSWSTPVLVRVPNGKTELVVSATKKIQGFDPDTGAELWHADSFTWYVCPSVVQHDGVVYTLQNSTCVAVRCGGKGDVTESHTLWQKKFGSTVPSCVVHEGHVYICPSGTVHCLNAKNGEVVYQKSLKPKSGDCYASPLVADGKIYIPSRFEGTFVIAAGPKFEQLAHNVFADDKSRTNASPIVDNGCILMRTRS